MQEAWKVNRYEMRSMILANIYVVFRRRDGDGRDGVLKPVPVMGVNACCTGKKHAG